MYLVVRIKKTLLIITAFALIAAVLFTLCSNLFKDNIDSMYTFRENGDSYIKWVDFNIPLALMQEAIKFDVESYNTPESVRLNWIELLAILGTKYYGKYSNYKVSDLHKIADELKNGKSPQDIIGNLKNYSYYLEAYTAVLGGLVGEYEIEVMENGVPEWKKQYGLKAFSPIAKGYAYTDYDDFGNSRSYGYKRKHLGHDLMALTGTPNVFR